MSTWYPPNISLKWPEYFRPDATDDVQIVGMTVAAKTAGLVTKRAAVQKLQRTFGIENVDQFMEALEEEAAENMKKAQEQMAAQAANADPNAPVGAVAKNEPDAKQGTE